MDIVSITEGRKKLGELISAVKYQRKPIALGRHGKAEALLIAVPDTTEDTPITMINAESPSFRFLADEPDLYSLKDLKKRYA